MDELNLTPQEPPETTLPSPPPIAQPTPVVPQIEPPITANTPFAQPNPAMTMPTNSLAVLSLVLSISSWILLWGVGGIAGLILGLMARNDIKHSHATQSGDGLALTGIILGAANVVFVCFGILCVIVGVAFVASVN